MPSLYTRANNEYINQDELAKRIAFERTISQVNKYYGDEKEVSIKPGQLTSQLRYGFDSLFENFRNAIEQVLAEEYNGDLTNQKTYEVIKKYNQLSSYLKNIMNMKQLSDKDQEEIQAKFNELKDKLNLLKKIAIDNQFLDSDDIVEMVDKINNVTADKKTEMKSVPATSTKMVKTLENKTDAESMINDNADLLKDVTAKLLDPQITASKKLADFNAERDKIAQFFSDPNNLDPVLKYQDIKENYDALKVISDDVSSDIKWFDENRAKIPTTIQDVKDNRTQMDAYITDFIDKADDRVVASIDKIKNDEIQAAEDEFTEGNITEQERDDEVLDVNNKYDTKYYTDFQTKVADVLNRYRQKLYKSDLDPITQEIDLNEKKTDTDAKLLALDEDQIIDILSELDKMNTGINNLLKKYIANTSAHLDKQKELQTVAQPPQVERKQKEPDKPPKKPKTVQKVKFIPYTNVGSFAKKYRDSANEYFNKTTNFTEFPKYLFTYITTPPQRKTPQAQAKAEADIQAKINKIKAQSVKAPWGEYLKMSPAEQEAYFT